jgi:ferric-dicitrate binding protein FerR (iron transport regulator)
MVGRTRLYQRTGSPLISGRSNRPPTRRWLVVLLVLAAVAAAVWVYLTYVPH